MKALQERFKQGPDVDFHGSYEVVDSEPSHKVRIQTVANEIWKTTGYRFTCVVQSTILILGNLQGLKA